MLLILSSYGRIGFWGASIFWLGALNVRQVTILTLTLFLNESCWDVFSHGTSYNASRNAALMHRNISDAVLPISTELGLAATVLIPRHAFLNRICVFSIWCA